MPKKELTVLEEKFIDEYYRCQRNIRIQTEELNRFPKGNISEKTIKGKKRYYLQWREGKNVKVKYIKQAALDEVRKQIDERYRWEKSIKKLEKF